MTPWARPDESPAHESEVQPGGGELAALARGDDAALGRLIRRWQRPLFSFACRYLQNEADAADMVAETFAKLYQQRRRISEGASVSSWLFTVLANRCRNRLRWARRHPAEPFDVMEGRAGIPCDQPQPDSALRQRERVSALQRAVADLPHELKTALLLHHYDRLSYREIAAIAGCSERGVETRLYRARQRLQAVLQPQLMD